MKQTGSRFTFKGSLMATAASGVMLLATPALAQVKPYYGTINPFYGTIDPFYGTINPFYGTINPFYGTINPFWGTINPFYGTINPFSGTVDPFWGDTRMVKAGGPVYSDIGTYWEAFGASWQSAQPLWSDPLKAADLQHKLDTIIADTELLWGASLRSATGHSFRNGVGHELFARHGIDPANGASLQKLTAEQRARFLLDWYDTLMNYSGRDRIDHWMATANWTPAVTHMQGSGADSVIGLLDAEAIGDADIDDNIYFRGGYKETVDGHGSAVASLMVAAHDGKGVMGIAPNAKVALYNPFDATKSASWVDVRKGIVALKGAGADVINMSLGVPGATLHPGWREQFSNAAIAPYNANTVYVIAAGNDGLSQTRNVEWSGALPTAFIVVGSVDIAGNISSFSNRPGSACLPDSGVCRASARLDESGALMNRFIVAPGELILVTDGRGGVTRMSGTSFAAPLVSGAIALLHDRWPWIKNNPHDAVEIILRSAEDLGAPGTDPVYGRGLLDVTASQSPLDYNNLTFYEVRGGVQTQRTAAQMKSGGVKPTWEANGVYFSLFETVGSTQRDFIVPMSSKLVGTVRARSGKLEHYQQYVSKRMTDWIKGGSGFSDVSTLAAPAGGGWRVAVSYGQPGASAQDGERLVPHSAIRVSDPSDRIGFSTGYGDGAMAIAPQAGFGLTTDHASDGGVNPLLGFASGGAFFAADMALSNRTAVSLGSTRQRLTVRDNPALTAADRAALGGLEAYTAGAVSLSVTHRIAPRLDLSLALTRMRESNGLLGVQSSVESDLRHGATSGTATVGATLALPSGLAIAASATAGRTRARERDQGLRTAGKGVLSSAFALAVTKAGVIGGSDMLRLSIAQPLHIERGKLSYDSVEVVDRSTGETGVVQRSFDIAGERRQFTGEMLYATALSEAGEASVFGRIDMQSRERARMEDVIVGGRLSFSF